MEALRDFEWNINYLQWLLNSKINQALSFPVQGSARAARSEEQRVVFLEGEVLMFGGVSREQVISVLIATGIPSDAYELTVDGPPLYFCSSINHPDVEFAAPYLLREEDLPYGFAGPDGTFQFSSPEIDKLRRSEVPIELDDVFTFFGTSMVLPQKITYDLCKRWERNNDNRGMILTASLGWVEGTSKSEILANLDAGKNAGVICRAGPDTVYRDYTTVIESYKQAVSATTSFRGWNGVVGGLSSNNNPRPPVLGWKHTLPNPMGGHGMRAYILQMPEGQLERFEVNPSPQQPYRGGEGVYPVVLVEFLRDVNVIF
jgi:hypothetical protein